MSEVLDVLALAAHPDDVELCAGGTMCLLAKQGYKTGVVDFTRGELGTRGTSEQRQKEAEQASKILGLAARENLGLPDGDIRNSKENQRKLVERIRRYRPHIVLINSLEERHPDHEHAARLSVEALFYSGLAKIETTDGDGNLQEPWRPQHVLQYMQSIEFTPTFVVDVGEVWQQRMDALRAFESQFHNPDYETSEPETFISNRGFFDWIEARARVYGYRIGAEFGEPFLYRHGPIGATDLMQVLSRERRFR
ncbi:MAG: bacillithiol biosynthesis deacetylase BshB1 [Rubricoccaceae bacterium]|nr:bacillithiol biosynthesis deacetylase BshB1 [Rubricoccaceae bacterium]